MIAAQVAPRLASFIRKLGLFFAAMSALAIADAASPPSDSGAALLSRDNLVAWCVVPFDAVNRSPEQRAAMLSELGIQRLAYDYRKEHIPQWEEEIGALKRHGIELVAWWFPTELNEEAKRILELLDRHELSPQLWVMGSNRLDDETGEERLKLEVERVKELAVAAKAIGSRVGLYNHGGWFGEPENQIAIIKRLRSQGISNVGIVYNLHHGHHHVDRFEELLDKMKPHLLAINLNGMSRDGDSAGKKIQVIGQGEMDARLIRILIESGWSGPVGILGHDASVDVRKRLEANLKGLKRIRAELDKDENPMDPAQEESRGRDSIQ